LQNSVSDLDSLIPDPAFQAEYRSGSRVLMAKKIEHELSKLFSIFVVHFALLNPDPDSEPETLMQKVR
jgi:hypothetical protein